MSLTNDQITAKNFQEFYAQIRPYLNGQVPPVFNKFSKSDLYSTDEQIVGRWIDGKPLYQKTYTGLNVTPAYDVWTNICVAPTGIGNLTSVKLLTNGDDDISGSGIEVALSNGKIRAEYLQNHTLRTIDIMTIQYTKTSDVSVAIGNDTDYSTTEKIVGTWIDGKPIYKYTYEMVSDTTIGYNNWNTTFTAPSSIDTVIKGELMRKTTTSGESICYPICCDVLPTARTSVKLQINTSSDVTCKSGSLITIWYTKTTD